MHTINDWAAARSDKWHRHLSGLEAMLAPIDAPLITALALTDPVRVVDVGCGAGATTLEILRQAPAGTVVHGYDLSPVLIDAAPRRPGAEASPVAFEVAEMGTAAPPLVPYHCLVSRLGVMFFADPPSAFANLRQWLVPGGRFALAAWGPVEDNGWMAATRAAVADAVALPPQDLTSPGPFRYADADALVSLLADAGFIDTTVADWRQPLPIGNRLPAPEAARFALASFSSFAELLSAAGPDALTRAERSLTARFAPYERDGAVTMPARVHIVTGRTRRAAGVRP